MVKVATAGRRQRSGEGWRCLCCDSGKVTRRGGASSSSRDEELRVFTGRRAAGDERKMSRGERDTSAGFALSISDALPDAAPKKDKAPPPASKPAKSGGGKQKKKKWSKGKQKEKVNNMVLFDQGSYDKLLTEVPKYKLITPSILSDRLRINGSLARRAIKDLMARGSIRMISAHSSQQIYTRATNT
ncbi:40S ribosomal protein S25-2 [Nymphaea thermarum]|nr:40S ribosomal protein S25-2 [Nymphaea thermarum]